MSSTPPDTFRYSPGFYDYIEQGARRSAQRLLPLIHTPLAPASVLDVGCGRGLWLSVWRELGVSEVLGLDGAYVDTTRLAIPSAAFGSMDIAQPFNLGRRWGLVQCLEVGEHIPGAQSSILVQNLVNHGDHILFSAAEPGQGGHHHINERPLEFWRELFAPHGYQAYDPVRPLLHADAAVEPWYRYNTLLYVRNSAAGTLPEVVRQTRLDAAKPIPRFAPLSWRLRRAFLRPLPTGVITALAQIKNRLNRSS
ncbi:MAG TPA: methyltransferase domain-containing protein [Lacunisphaera sp.]|nr:methyltransferase domain-containing protein [Lacunisphaera sp.]